MYGKSLSPQTLQNEIIPTLEVAGLVVEEPDPYDTMPLRRFRTVAIGRSLISESDSLAPTMSHSRLANEGIQENLDTMKEEANCPAHAVLFLDHSRPKDRGDL